MTFISDEKIIQFLNQTKEVYGDELNIEKKIISSKNIITKEDFPSDLDVFYNQINKCHKCSLGSSRTNFVFGVGDKNASLMLVGEAPGENEDIKGEPFVGRAGKLLDKMLESIHLNRTKVYISNVVNYRPPANRKPTEAEIERYLPYLKSHIEIINPKILVLLGSTALNTLIGNEVVISKARGKWIQKEIGTVKPWIIASFHPAFLMRQPEQKKLAWIDLKMVRDKIKNLKI